MTAGEEKMPPCFAELDTVFPRGKHGLRETPENCLVCSHKTACLRTVLEGVNGLKVREELLDRAYASGKISFLERWSQKKDLKRRIREKIREQSRGGNDENH
jgi:hypothetical protein